MEHVGFLLFALLFLVIFLLYALPMEPYVYGLLLCLTALLIRHALGYHAWRGRHAQLVRVATDPATLLSEAPEPQTLSEAELLDMLTDMKGKLDQMVSAWASADRASLDYYATWVHQIKTPLSVMRLLLQESDTPESRRLLSEVFRTEEYVQMVLGYMRLTSGETDYVFETIDLDEVLRETIRDYAPVMIERRLSVRFAPSGVKARGDRKWLRFILDQLLSNAVKYTRKGHSELSAGTEPCVSVTDTGIGIAPEDIPRLFDRGFTGYNGHADRRSTGLGLYLAGMAGRALGWRIEVVSEVGQGTTVTVHIPETKMSMD